MESENFDTPDTTLKFSILSWNPRGLTPSKFNFIQRDWDIMFFPEARVNDSEDVVLPTNMNYILFDQGRVALYLRQDINAQVLYFEQNYVRYFLVKVNSCRLMLAYNTPNSQGLDLSLAIERETPDLIMGDLNMHLLLRDSPSKHDLALLGTLSRLGLFILNESSTFRTADGKEFVLDYTISREISNRFKLEIGNGWELSDHQALITYFVPDRNFAKRRILKPVWQSWVLQNRDKLRKRLLEIDDGVLELEYWDRVVTKNYLSSMLYQIYHKVRFGDIKSKSYRSKVGFRLFQKNHRRCYNVIANENWAEEFKTTLGADELLWQDFSVRQKAIQHFLDQTKSKPYTQKEVENAILNLSRRIHAPGPDGLSEAHFLPCIREVTQVINTRASYCKWISYAYVIPIFKKGDIADPKCYQKIHLMDAMDKIFDDCIRSRLIAEDAEKKMGSWQFGFRSGVSAEIVAKTLELAEFTQDLSQKGQECILMFYDLANAFDTVHHDTLIKKIIWMGFSDTTIRDIMLSIQHHHVALYGTNDFVRTTNGVKQGSPLSPLLWNLYIADLQELVEANGGRITLYADDILIVVDTEDDAKTIYELMEWYAQEYHLTINYKQDKSSYIHPKKAGNKSEGDILDMPQVREYEYLGLTIGFSKFGYPIFSTSIEARLQKFRAKMLKLQEFFKLPSNYLRSQYKNKMLLNSVVRGSLYGVMVDPQYCLSDTPWFEEDAGIYGTWEEAYCSYLMTIYNFPMNASAELVYKILGVKPIKQILMEKSHWMLRKLLEHGMVESLDKFRLPESIPKIGFDRKLYANPHCSYVHYCQVIRGTALSLIVNPLPHDTFAYCPVCKQPEYQSHAGCRGGLNRDDAILRIKLVMKAISDRCEADETIKRRFPLDSPDLDSNSSITDKKLVKTQMGDQLGERKCINSGDLFTYL